MSVDRPIGIRLTSASKVHPALLVPTVPYFETKKIFHVTIFLSDGYNFSYIQCHDQ